MDCPTPWEKQKPEKINENWEHWKLPIHRSSVSHKFHQYYFTWGNQINDGIIDGKTTQRDFLLQGNRLTCIHLRITSGMQHLRQRPRNMYVAGPSKEPSAFEYQASNRDISIVTPAWKRTSSPVYVKKHTTLNQNQRTLHTTRVTAAQKHILWVKTHWKRKDSICVYLMSCQTWKVPWHILWTWSQQCGSLQDQSNSTSDFLWSEIAISGDLSDEFASNAFAFLLSELYLY